MQELRGVHNGAVTAVSAHIREQQEPTKPVVVSATVRADSSEVWGMFPEVGRCVIRELADWGVRLVVSSKPPFEVGDETSFELRNKDRIIVSCVARVMGLVEYDIGFELMLWIVEDTDRWCQAVERIGAHTDRRAAVDPPKLSCKRLPVDRVVARMRALAAGRARARVRSFGRSGDEALPARLDPECGLLLEWHPRLAEMQAPFEIEVDGPFSTITFVEDSLRWDTVPTPKEVRVTRQRQMRRVAAPSGAKVIVVGVDGDESKSVEMKMQDVSFGGVAAALRESSPGLRPGTSISDVVVTWRGGPMLRFTGNVCHRSPGGRPDREVVGLQLRGTAEAQRERWAREVENLLYPTTRSFGHDYQSIWDVFEASGYFDLSEGRRERSDFQQLRSAFESAYSRISAAPDLGCLTSYESSTRVEATIAGLRVWERSWIGLQLARNPVRPHLARSDSSPLQDILFHVFERAGANTELDWLVHYVRDDAPNFSRTLFRDLILSIPGACGVPFEAWKLGISMRGELRAPHVNTASSEQVDVVLAKMKGIRPAAYLEALDLIPERFEQRELREEWSFHDLLRERTVLVAIDGGRIVAAAVLDAVEDGLHLYGLLDSARLYEFEPGGRDYFGELLIGANEWFYSLAKSHFVCLDEGGFSSIMRSAGAKSLGRAVTTVLPSYATPELLERVTELTVPKG